MSNEENFDDGDGQDDVQYEEDGQGGSDIDVQDLNDDENDLQVQIENLFYEAEDNRKTNPQIALQKYTQCFELEYNNMKNEYFKRIQALENIILLEYRLKNSEKMIEHYKLLLQHVNEATRNECSETIDNILNLVSEQCENTDSKNDYTLLTHIYQITLDVLKLVPSLNRMQFSISAKLCKKQLERRLFDQAKQTLDNLHSTCKLKDGSDDMEKGSQLIEIYALRIQLLTAIGDTVRLKELFNKTKELQAEINDPRSMSVIRECQGKMQANENNQNRAYGEFFAAFLQYQEIGHSKAKNCLKYLVIANMLSQNDANPFDAREAKVYENLEEIREMAKLRLAYEENDIYKFEEILDMNKQIFSKDLFIQKHIPALKNRIRIRTLIKIIQPFSIVQLDQLAYKLYMSQEDLKIMCKKMILDSKINARIDQINSTLLIVNDKLFSTFPSINQSRNELLLIQSLKDQKSKLSSIQSSILSVYQKRIYNQTQFNQNKPQGLCDYNIENIGSKILVDINSTVDDCNTNEENKFCQNKRSSCQSNSTNSDASRNFNISAVDNQNLDNTTDKYEQNISKEVFNEDISSDKQELCEKIESHEFDSSSLQATKISNLTILNRENDTKNIQK